jgi:hypothetical protein
MMNKTFQTLTLSVTLLLAPLAVQAQETVPPAPPAATTSPAAPPTPPTPPTPPEVRTVYIGESSRIATTAQATVLKGKITLDANNLSLREAIKSVADQAKIPVEFAEDFPADARVTMTLKGVPAADALRLLTREGGVQWRYEQTIKDGKKSEVIKVGKKLAVSSRGTAISVVGAPSTDALIRIPGSEDSAAQASSEAMIASKEVQKAIRSALEASRDAMRTYNIPQAFTTYRSANLPDKRVKLDSRNAKIRDVLKDVLKQANLAYALDNDVPEDVRRSFTFENVPVATALDLITRSVEIGWRAQQQKDGKTLILIGKKYATPFGSFRLMNGLSSPLGQLDSLTGDVNPVATAFEAIEEATKNIDSELADPSMVVDLLAPTMSGEPEYEDM